MTYQSGPVNIGMGNSANFMVCFVSSAGTETSPSSGTVTLAYTNIYGNPQTDTVVLTLSGGRYSGTWSAANAAPGLVDWTAIGDSTTMATGQIRVVQRQYL